MRKYSITIQHRFTKEEFEKLWKENIREYLTERRASNVDMNILNKEEGSVYALSVIELENKIEFAKRSLNNLNNPSVLDTLKAYEIELENFKGRQILETTINVINNILGRIQQRASEFLNKTEYDLLIGNTYSDIIQRTKEFVDAKLLEISPDVLQKFISIDIRNGDKESFAQSLVTCRRVLKSFADSIYPPSKSPVLCSDGKKRILGEEKYINRIRQFIYENYGVDSLTTLIQSQLDNLGSRVDRIYSLTNKGVHADVNEQEANQCIIQTYLAIGDILD